MSTTLEKGKRVHTSLIEKFMTDYSSNSGEFPRVLSVSAESAGFQLQLEVTAKLDGFRGHFPGNPVLAGIVQFHWAARFSGELFEYQSVPMEIKRLKFKNIVQPPATLSLSLRQTVDLQVEFDFSSPQHSHSSGLMIFEHDTS